jgi:RNA polymerase sigma-70 factor, ECF subfamily
MRSDTQTQPKDPTDAGTPDDDALVTSARSGDPTAFELLMRRHNQRVYRVVRSVLRDDADVEDVMQQAYLAAFAHLEQFAGTAQWSTWVCRIAINEAISRNRQRHRLTYTDDVLEEAVTELWRGPTVDPERSAGGRELRQLVEEEIDRLPEALRTVVVLREIEGMSTAETAAVLQVGEDVVKTRLYRARSSLRQHIEKRVGERLGEVFAFGNQRCDRIVAAVLAHWDGRAWLGLRGRGLR